VGRPGRPRATPERLRRGARLGSLKIEALARTGGFAHVYRALAEDGTPAAIKVPRRDAWVDPVARARFRREADLLARLEHPGLPRLRERGALADGRPWLAMSWIDGRTIADELGARGPMSVPEAAALVGALARIVAVLHDARVVHRDVTAHNVLISRGGRVLVDVGIALDEHAPVDVTRSAADGMLGSAHAMAPEQISGAAVDARADVYALGVLLHQVLTGRPPFEAGSVAEIQERHLSAPPPRPSERVPTAAALDDLVLACLAKDPARRPASAAWLAEALIRAGAPSDADRLARARAVIWVRVDLPPPGGGFDADACERASQGLDRAADALVAAGLEVLAASGLSVVARGAADVVERARRALTTMGFCLVPLRDGDSA
jgi:serine/threonine-protein kinase